MKSTCTPLLVKTFRSDQRPAEFARLWVGPAAKNSFCHSCISLTGLLIICGFFCLPLAVAEDRPRHVISRASTTITIDGRLDEAAWKAAKSVGDFKFPWWENGKKEQTVAKLLWDDTHLYVCYRCEDAHIWAEHTERDSAVWLDDCVEIFVAPNPDQPDNYFNIEMNVRGVFLDQHHPEGPEKEITEEWNASGIKIATCIDGTLNDDRDRDHSWTLEAAIPFKNFSSVARNTPPKPGDVWHLNLNRLGGKTNPQFSQWSASNTEEPQFHAPRDFGHVVFSDRAE
ncbi:MAG: carbohydrate-binding family 9-like protein [Planctomycetota bacterium]